MKKRIYFFWAGIITVCGALWYAFQTSMLILHIQPRVHDIIEKTEKKKITIYWYNNTQKMEETIDIIWAANKYESMRNFITAWLVFMQEEGCIPKSVTIENSARAPLSNELCISFSESIFYNNDSIIKKWRIIEGFFATLQPLFPDIAHIRLMVKDKPLYDSDIDCTTSFPVVSHLQRYESSASFGQDSQPTHRLIILHPKGDKEQTGRVIHQEFERTYTRYIAEKIKTFLSEKELTTVIITHDVRQAIDQEQCATLANRLNASLYVHITCFETKGSIPEISCYFPLHNPTTDFWIKKRDPLSLIPLRAAYIQHINQSRAWCMGLSDNLKKNNQQSMSINNYYGLPLNACTGIAIPSIVIECGIPSDEHSNLIAQALAQGLDAMHKT